MDITTATQTTTDIVPDVDIAIERYLQSFNERTTTTRTELRPLRLDR